MEDTTPNQNKNQHATLNGNYKFIVRGGNNYIHPTAIIGDDVVLGEDNYIGAFCYITGKTIIGNNMEELQKHILHSSKNTNVSQVRRKLLKH